MMYFAEMLTPGPAPLWKVVVALRRGNFALLTDDLPSVIRRFGEQGKIFFVHLRDVRGNVDSFVETFHDDGQTDMLACMQAYRDVGFEGVARPDHVRPWKARTTRGRATSLSAACSRSGTSRGFIRPFTANARAEGPVVRPSPNA